MRAGLVLLSCLALASNASAQVNIEDAPVTPVGLRPGSLVVSADPASCLIPSTLNVAGVAPTGSSNGIGSKQTGTCRWVITGLGAGRYEIGLTNARGSGGRVRFDYVPGQLAELRIPAPGGTVTGIVRINGVAVPGAKISFMGRLIQSGMPTVVTQADGSYEASIADAGLYSLRLSGDDIYGRSAKATFAEGVNRYDWDITGGTLVVTDARRARARTFTVRVGDADGGFQGWSAAAFGPTRVLRGTPFGTYTIDVQRGVAAVERISTVTVAPDAPRAEAVIDVP